MLGEADRQQDPPVEGILILALLNRQITPIVNIHVFIRRITARQGGMFMTKMLISFSPVKLYL